MSYDMLYTMTTDDNTMSLMFECHCLDVTVIFSTTDNDRKVDSVDENKQTQAEILTLSQI